LQGNEARLHSGAMTKWKRAKANIPGFIGRKIGKRTFWRIFQIVLDQFKPEKPRLC